MSEFHLNTFVLQLLKVSSQLQITILFNKGSFCSQLISLKNIQHADHQTYMKTSFLLFPVTSHAICGKHMHQHHVDLKVHELQSCSSL